MTKPNTNPPRPAAHPARASQAFSPDAAGAVPNTPPGRLCKDCKHCRPYVVRIFFMKSLHYEYAKCAASIEPVSGEPAEFCEFKRKYGGACGPEAVLWEAA